MIQHSQLHQEDREWLAVQEYVRGLQRLLKYYENEKNWLEVPALAREIFGWWNWFEILGNLNDTDWAVDPYSGRIW